MSALVTIALSGSSLTIPESQFTFPFAASHVHHLAFSLALRRGKTGTYAWASHHISLSLPLPLALPLSVTDHVGMEGVFSLAFFAVLLPVPFRGWVSEELALTW